MKFARYMMIAASAAMLSMGGTQDLTEFKAKVNEKKTEARNSLKPFRYDGSKVTYFTYKSLAQSKEVEVYLFSNTEYKFALNTELCKHGPLNVKIYDEAKGTSGRVLLSEMKEMENGTHDLSSNALQEAYTKAKGANAGRLKRVFVEYSIPAVKDAAASAPIRGAIILVMGYKM